MVRGIATYRAVLTISRLIIAAFCCALLAVGIEYEPQSVIHAALVIYFFLCLIDAVIIWVDWYYDYTLAIGFVASDIIVLFFIALNVSSIEGTSYFLGLLIFARICVILSERWPLKKAAILVGSVLFALFFMVSFQSSWLAGDFSMDGALILPFAFVAVVSTWFGANNSSSKISHFLPDGFDPGSSLHVSILNYATSSTAASTATLFWLEAEDSELRALKLHPDGTVENQTVQSFSAPRALLGLRSMQFDVERQLSLHLRDDRYIGYLELPELARSLLAELECTRGICMPLDFGPNERGWLVLSGWRRMNWRGLRVVRQVCDEIDFGARWHRSAMRGRSEALGLLRRTVAADLHDSVAHSLAGAKLMLAALRSKAELGAGTLRSVESIESALAAEQLHVRSLIGQLRAENSETFDVNLIADLRADCRVHEKRWGAAILIEESDFQVYVPMWLSLQIQQLVREMISNGARHARAKRFKLRCKKVSHEVLLQIAHDINTPAPLRCPFKPGSLIERVGALDGRAAVACDANEVSVQLAIPIGELHGLVKAGAGQSTLSD